MIRSCFLACLMLFALAAPAVAAEFGSAQAECNYLAKDYGVSPENMAEFMADCVARLRPVYEPDTPSPTPVPEEPPAPVEQPQPEPQPGAAPPPGGEVVHPPADQGDVPQDEQVAPDDEAGDEPEVLEGQAVPEDQEQPQADVVPPEEAPDEDQQ
jgi:hypothetical protein